MIPFLAPLPCSVEIYGEEYAVATAYQDWIGFELMLHDESLSDDERLSTMLQFYNEPQLLPELDAAVQSLIRFYLCGKEPSAAKANDNGQASGILLSYEHDMPMIYAGFMQAYGVDLLTESDMHWWRFRALLDGLPQETQMARIMGLRATDTSAMDRKERERVEKLKAMVAIGKAAHHEATEEDMLAKARKVREQRTKEPQQ